MVRFEDIVDGVVLHTVEQLECPVCKYIGKWRMKLDGTPMGSCPLCGWDPKRQDKYVSYDAYVQKVNMCTTNKQRDRMILNMHAMNMPPVVDDDDEENPVYAMTRVIIKRPRKKSVRQRRGTGMMT